MILELILQQMLFPSLLCIFFSVSLYFDCPLLPVSDNPGLRRRCWHEPEPAGPHHLPDLLMLLLQRHGRRQQEARDLLRHLGRRHHRPGHVVSPQRSRIRRSCATLQNLLQTSRKSSANLIGNLCLDYTKHGTLK